MIKAIQIKEIELGKDNPTEQIAEVHMNLSQLCKKQMIYEQALSQMISAKNIYDQIMGHSCLKSTLCLFEIAKVKFLMKLYDEALTISNKCQANFNHIF